MTRDAELRRVLRHAWYARWRARVRARRLIRRAGLDPFREFIDYGGEG